MDKTKLQKIVASPWLAFAVLFAGMLAYHMGLPLVDHDEAFYADVFANMNLIEFSVDHYQTWSSRTFIEPVFALFSALPRIVWRLLNPCILVGFVACIAHFAGVLKNTLACWGICFLVCLYPWPEMSTAGWVVTTIGYLWTAAAAALAFLPLYNDLMGISMPRGIGGALRALCFPLLLFAANMEQVAVFMLVVLAALLVYRVATRQKIPWLLPAQLVLVCASIAYALASPGAAIRRGIEVTNGFSTFDMLAFLSKLELGLSATLNPVIFGRNWIFDGFCFLLALLVFLRNKNWLYRFLGLLPLGISGVFSYTTRFFPFLAFFTESIGQEGLISRGNYLALPSYLPMILLYGVFGLVLIGLYLAFGHGRQSLFAIALLVAGVASKAVMGLSPSIWTSGGRTGFFLAFTLIGLSGFILGEALPLVRPYVLKWKSRRVHKA